MSDLEKDERDVCPGCGSGCTQCFRAGLSHMEAQHDEDRAEIEKLKADLTKVVKAHAQVCAWDLEKEEKIERLETEYSSHREATTREYERLKGLIEDQRQEIERLKGHCEHMTKQNTVLDEQRDRLNAQAAEIERLKAEVERFRGDSDRELELDLLAHEQSCHLKLARKALEETANFLEQTEPSASSPACQTRAELCRQAIAALKGECTPDEPKPVSEEDINALWDRLDKGKKTPKHTDWVVLDDDTLEDLRDIAGGAPDA